MAHSKKHPTVRRRNTVKNLLQAVLRKTCEDDTSVPMLKKEDLYKDLPSNYVLQ